MKGSSYALLLFALLGAIKIGAEVVGIPLTTVNDFNLFVAQIAIACTMCLCRSIEGIK